MITDTGIADKLIQPIRFFRNTYGAMIDKRNYNYFESSKKNIVHQITHVPTLALIKFSLIFPQYYYTLTECKIYCPDRTTSKFDIKAKINNPSDLSLVPYTDGDGVTTTRFTYQPGSGFSSACPNGLGVIRVIATNGTTPITWESDLIDLFVYGTAFPSGAPDTETDMIDNEMGIT